MNLIRTTFLWNALSDRTTTSKSGKIQKVSKAVKQIWNKYSGNLMHNGAVYTSRLKNTVPTYFFYVSVKYKPISIKIGRHVLQGTLNKYVLTLPWEI